MRIPIYMQAPNFNPITNSSCETKMVNNTFFHFHQVNWTQQASTAQAKNMSKLQKKQDFNYEKQKTHGCPKLIL